MLRRILAALLVAAAGYAVADDKPKAAPELAGSWKIVSGTKDGDAIPAAKLGAEPLVVTADAMTLKTPDETFKFTYTVDAKATPVAVDLTMTAPEAFKGSKAKGIIEVKGDKAKLAYNPQGGERPKDFAAKSGSGDFSFVLEKVKAK